MAMSREEIDEKFNEIIERVSNGEPLRKVIKSLKMANQTFYNWIDEDEQKEKQYARACELRSELKFESIEADYLENPRIDPSTGKIDSAWVQLQRLKIDAKKWELSKLNPKKYGDKLDLNNKLSGSVNIISLGNGTKPETDS